jgi:hypothetical protein
LLFFGRFISYLYQIFKIVYFRKKIMQISTRGIVNLRLPCIVSRKYNQYLICMYLICIYVIGNEKKTDFGTPGLDNNVCPIVLDKWKRPLDKWNLLVTCPLDKWNLLVTCPAGQVKKKTYRNTLKDHRNFANRDFL